jgi:hypothetical protein
MTKLLEQAFNEAAKLPDDAQDALAEVLLADLESERAWNSARFEFPVLERLAEDAVRDHRTGRTSSLDPSEM